MGLRRGDSAQPAHWASWWAASGKVAKRLGVDTVEALRAEVPCLDAALTDLEASLREAGWPRTGFGEAQQPLSQRDHSHSRHAFIITSLYSNNT